MELSQGDALLKKDEELRADGRRLSEEEREEMLAHYIRGLELCDQAGCAGWVYGHINVANFLAGERYAADVRPAICQRARMQGPKELRARWQAAADLENLWAMNQLALLECREKRIEEAVQVWEKAAKHHYPTAHLNLALYIYGSGRPRENRQRYQECLEQASADGSAQASYELAQLYLPTAPLIAGMLLSRAEEQNYRKFNNQLYHQIRELRKKL